MIEFTIPLTPISKKNSQQIFYPKGRNAPIIVPSAKYKEYEKKAMPYIPRDEFIDYPVNVKCLFYMPTHRRCDLVNMQEAILDVMVKAGFLEDDNFNIVEAMDGSRVLYDKENPRTEVFIERIVKDDPVDIDEETPVSKEVAIDIICQKFLDTNFESDNDVKIITDRITGFIDGYNESD